MNSEAKNKHDTALRPNESFGQYKPAKSLSLELTTPVDDIRPVYIVGNFNDWNVDDKRFLMRRVSRGKFVFTFPNDMLLPQTLHYKYVRGGWENKELDAFGNATTNRILENPEGAITDFVPRWNNYGLDYNPAFLPQKQLVSDAFDMPQLKKKRRVIALLPFDYDKNPQKRYPVIYLQDAQNLFNPRSPFGNWAIDKKLAVLAERGMGDIIVIAVDHGGSERVNEFLPPLAKQNGGESPRSIGKPDGRKYVKFLATSLKAHIDATFRTLPERIHTGIGGSSMGGLISIYAGLMYPSVFGRLMVFSPSLWAMQNVQFDTIDFYQPQPTKIYAYAGEKEGSNMVPNVQRFHQSIQNRGYDSSGVNIKVTIDPQGLHTEKRWGEEFPKAMEWLFFS
jgi:predicted alpha/beta superfamily hydrolase